MLHLLLRLSLALVLGLGPLGASVVAASLHAPFCGCTGCGMDGMSGMDAEGASCCSSAVKESDEPAFVAQGPGCACALVAPSREPEPATAPRVGPSQSSARIELAHGQRAVELARCLAPAPASSAPRAEPPGEREPGPAGSQRARGAVRAAALGSLRL